MTPARLLHALLCLALAACTGMGTQGAPHHASASVPAKPALVAAPSVYVMRHLQRGEGPDPALSAEGKANAERLVGEFAALLGADRRSTIYVSKTRRARETAAPLAAALGLTPREYDPADTAALVAAVAGEPGSVLIVGHSNTVADIVGRLGGVRPADLSERDYGEIWRIDRKGGQTSNWRLDE